MEIPWMALRGSGAFPAGLGGFLSTPAGRGRGRRTDQAGHGGTAGTGTPQKPPPEPLAVPPTADVPPPSDRDSAGGAARDVGPQPRTERIPKNP